MGKKVAPEAMKNEPDHKSRVKEFCKVIFPYDAQNSDELSIKEGDVVTIISKDCADTGWWLGEMNGRQGVFPDNFVKLFIPDSEKERPKKPPPPAAPATKHTSEKKSEAKKTPPDRPESLPHRAEERGDETKTEISKPLLPVILPKKPLPPKSSSTVNRPSLLPPKRPDRPERPVGPQITCDASSAAADKPVDKPIDPEDLDSVVSSSEKLNHLTTSRPRVTDRRPRSQVFTSSSLSSPDLLESPEEQSRDKEVEKEEQDSFTPKSLDNSKKVPKAVMTAPEKSSLPPKPVPLSATERGRSEQGTVSLEELKAQLRELKGAVDLMKSQHRQEIKQLVSELDEEKRIRISMQVEVEQIRKSLAK